MPFFSVIIPAYNRASIITKAIDSVLCQTFEDFELIIIDDASTDNTEEVVAKYKDNRILYLKNTENRERSYSRNKGIKYAQGDYICFLDSDDLYREDHLELLYETIIRNQNRVALYFTGYIWNYPNRVYKVILEPLESRDPVEYVVNNQIATPAVCIHRSILRKHKFNEKFTINEDVELFARIANEYPLVKIDNFTVDVTAREQDLGDTSVNSISLKIEVFRHILENPALRGRLSREFRRKRLKDLYHKLIVHYHLTEQYRPMVITILRSLISYPLDRRNLSKLGFIVYQLPGGHVVRTIVSKLKRRGGDTLYIQ